MSPASFTFSNSSGSAKSWIDHCFATKRLVTNVSVPFCVSASDHLPLLINADDILTPHLCTYQSLMPSGKINWNKLSNHDKVCYQHSVRDQVLRQRWVICDKSGCSNPDHKRDIGMMTEKIITILTQSAAKVRHSRVMKAVDKSRIVNGWNDLVKDSYTDYRESYIN